MKAKLGMSPIAWWNDDLPELSDDVSLEECLRQSRSAGFTGMEQGRRFPGNPQEMLPILRADSNLEVAARDPRGELIVLRFNSLNPPFDNAKARQAFAMVVDQESYLQAAVAPGEGKECRSIYTCDSPYSTDVGTELIGSGDVDWTRVALFAGNTQDWFWNFDNNGLRLAQLRFYEL